MTISYNSEGIITKPVAHLAKESSELTDLIIAEKDPSKLQDLTNLFKQNQLKKNLLRTNKLNNLLELIDDEMVMRVATNPEAISDRDLLNYMNATQQSIQNSFDTFEKLPVIQVNNVENNVNINNDKLSKESREVVINKVNEILAQLKGEPKVIDVEVDDES